jgi:hypothetical protein
MFYCILDFDWWWSCGRDAEGKDGVDFGEEIVICSGTARWRGVDIGRSRCTPNTAAIICIEFLLCQLSFACSKPIKFNECTP